VRIVIMFNPVSGKGRSAEAAERTRHALIERGHDAVAVASRLEMTADWLDPALQGAQLLVVAGGDGAMRMAAPAAVRQGLPVFHLPLGTENLFAREFGMNAAIDTLARAIERWNVRVVDVGMANGHWFLLMASIGFDAEVVHTLAASRGKSISHLTYVKPILTSLRTWTPPAVSIEVDGQSLVSERRGMVVVANSRQYGWRIDPASRADMTDGLLDVVFMPAETLIGVVGWTMRCRTRRQYRHGAHVSIRGRHVTVRCDQPLRYQLDGDPPGAAIEPPLEGAEMPAITNESDRWILNCNVVPQRLRVLCGRDGPQTSVAT
jgi:diacylglycerol kinase family enzyme